MSVSSDSSYMGCKGFDAKKPISRLSVANTSAEEFFKSYVATRTPAVFNDQITDAACSTNVSNNWSNTYLRKKCGDCKIKIETRADGGSFGKGNETKTTFREFLTAAPEGRSYLTTQDLVYDEDGRPAIISPPLTALQEDYPLTPMLFNNLVVSNINLWFGYTRNYSTSGLHHDFHDNIYILLRGEKRFTLISPAEAHNLYTVGTISRIHPNGRINYEGQLPTKADGSDLRAEAALLASTRLQKVAERLAQAAENDASEQDLEDELDAALDQVLDAEMEGSEEGSEEEEEEGSEEESEGESRDDEEEEEDGSEVDWNGQDDYVDSDNDNENGNNNNEESDEGESSESEGEEESASSSEEDDEQPQKKRARADLGLLGRGLEAALQASRDSNKNKNQKGGGNGTSSGGVDKKKSDGSSSSSSAASALPDNFSRVDTDLPAAALRQQFPLFAALQDRGGVVDVVLKAGQMLYIPAGWFHEVRSRSNAEGSGDSEGEDEGEYGGHLALNYWFHPPDSADFEKPYTSDFWRRDFDDRAKK